MHCIAIFYCIFFIGFPHFFMWNVLLCTVTRCLLQYYIQSFIDRSCIFSHCNILQFNILYYIERIVALEAFFPTTVQYIAIYCTALEASLHLKVALEGEQWVGQARLPPSCNNNHRHLCNNYQRDHRRLCNTYPDNHNRCRKKILIAVAIIILVIIIAVAIIILVIILVVVASEMQIFSLRRELSRGSQVGWFRQERTENAKKCNFPFFAFCYLLFLRQERTETANYSVFLVGRARRLL